MYQAADSLTACRGIRAYEKQGAPDDVIMKVTSPENHFIAIDPSQLLGLGLSTPPAPFSAGLLGNIYIDAPITSNNVRSISVGLQTDSIKVKMILFNTMNEYVIVKYNS